MSIFGAIIFASFIMTSCGGGASADASPEATGGAGTSEVKAPASPEATATAPTPASPEATATEVTATPTENAPAASADAKKTR